MSRSVSPYLRVTNTSLEQKCGGLRQFDETVLGGLVLAACSGSKIATKKSDAKDLGPSLKSSNDGMMTPMRLV